MWAWAHSMATNSSTRLSTNLAAMSYAMGIAAQEQERSIEVGVSQGARPSALARRSQNPDIAPAADMALEYEPGRPFKNFGRRLAWEAGIALPYNMQQAADVAEQARTDYANQTEQAAQTFETFDAQMQENIDGAPSDVDRRVYQQYQKLGKDAAHTFFDADASAEQRSGALGQLDKINAESRHVLAADANEHDKFVRGFITNEYATSRTGLANIDMAENDRVFSTESELAKLDNVARGSNEEQVVLRDMLGAAASRSKSTLAATLGAAGQVAGAVPNPYAAVVGAGLQGLGAIASNKDSKLDRDVVVKMLIEQNDALDQMTEAFRPQVVGLHEQIVKDGEAYGLPVKSWSATPIDIPTPYTDAYRTRYFGGDESRTPAPAAPPTTSEPGTAEPPRPRGRGLENFTAPPAPGEPPRLIVRP